MLKDYSGRYSSVGRRQKVRRRGGAVVRTDSGMLWKAIGVFASFAAVVGVAASLWLGWQIDSGLGELGTVRELRQEATLRNKTLLARRDGLHSREQVAASAARLGLYAPAAQQVRKP
ncbi:MAG: hypothetical protein OEV73_02250 [Desulfobulbaceae bacterium]|nr:hypothetical protein [Desulfobulbaceae bacterium]